MKETIRTEAEKDPEKRHTVGEVAQREAGRILELLGSSRG